MCRKLFLNGMYCICGGRRHFSSRGRNRAGPSVVHLSRKHAALKGRPCDEFYNSRTRLGMKVRAK